MYSGCSETCAKPGDELLSNCSQTVSYEQHKFGAKVGGVQNLSLYKSLHDAVHSFYSKIFSFFNLLNISYEHNPQALLKLLLPYINNTNERDII